MKHALDGGDWQTIGPGFDFNGLSVGDGFVYGWSLGGLGRMPLSGDKPTFIKAEDKGDHVDTVATVIAADGVFWGCTNQAIVKLPLDGGPKTVVSPDGPNHTDCQLAMANDQLYWIRRLATGHALVTAPKTGGPAKTLVKHEDLVAFAVGHDQLFWSEQGSMEGLGGDWPAHTNDGAIHAIPLTHRRKGLGATGSDLWTQGAHQLWR